MSQWIRMALLAMLIYTGNAMSAEGESETAYVMRVDGFGSGAFRAPRDGGQREHNGWDVLSRAGNSAVSLVDGTVSKVGYCYSTDDHFRYVEVTTPDGFAVRLFYIAPNDTITVGVRVHKGDVLGKVQSISARYGSGMKDHIHIEVRKHGMLFNPEHFLRTR